MEDEIDLQKYIDVLLRHWKLIVSITVITVSMAALVSFLSPSTYEANAAVLVNRVRSVISFEPKYKTLLEENIASQRKTLIALVKSNTVATQVAEQLGDKLKPEERGITKMLDKVQVTERGDLIEISVKSTDPHKATVIANTWAECYENYVNGLYSGLPQLPAELQVQTDAARKEYEEKQKALEGFVGSNRIDELSRQIADKDLLCDIKSLRQQIKAGSSSSASAAANSLALVLLQAGAFTSLPVELQVSLDEMSGLNVSLDDIDVLISTLELRSGGTREQPIVELRQEILKLMAELEQEKSRQQELENSRDIAWKTCTILESKAAEVKVAALAQNTVVQVATIAVVPDSPVAPRRVINIGIALILGLIMGTFATFGVEYFKKTG